jgi:hypothetical protein
MDAVGLFPISKTLSADNKVPMLQVLALYIGNKRTDPLDIFIDEYYQELARRTVEQKFSKRPF